MEATTKVHHINLDRLYSLIDRIYGEHADLAKRYVDTKFHINEITITIPNNPILYMFIQQLRALLDLLPVAYPSKDNRSKVYSSSCRYYGDPNGINMDSQTIPNEIGYLDAISTTYFDINCKAKEITIYKQNNDKSDEMVAIPLTTNDIKDQQGNSVAENGECHYGGFLSYIMPNEVYSETFKIEKGYHKGLKRYICFTREIGEKNTKVKFFTYFDDDHKQILKEVCDLYKNTLPKMPDFQVFTSKGVDDELYEEEKAYMDQCFRALSDIIA